jgi:hypothetical protein
LNRETLPVSDCCEHAFVGNLRVQDGRNRSFGGRGRTIEGDVEIRSLRNPENDVLKQRRIANSQCAIDGGSEDMLGVPCVVTAQGTVVGRVSGTGDAP